MQDKIDHLRTLPVPAQSLFIGGAWQAANSGATMDVISAAPPARLPDRVVRDIRRTRRHPRPWRSEYLHLRRLVSKH